MRLDFNILWVEDQPANVKSSREKIERSIRNEGFRLQTQFAASVEEAKGFLASDIFGDHIDLVLIDYLATKFAKEGDALSGDARKHISDRLKVVRKEFEKDIAALEKAKTVTELADLHRIYTSLDRINLLRKILGGGGKHATECDAM